MRDELIRKGILQPTTKFNVMVTLYSILAYIISFVFLFYVYGHGMAISAIIPVIVVGWLFGFLAGIGAAIISFPVNILMCQVLRVDWWEIMIVGGSGISGTAALILIGAIVGRMRDLSVELKKSEERYQRLIENASDAIISANKDGIVTTFNKKAEELFGYSREEIVGKPAILLSPPDDREKENKLLEEFKKNHRLSISGKTIEGKGLRKNGEEFPVESSFYMLNVQGEYIITSLLRDVSERKKTENEMRETRDFLESIFKTSADGIIVTTGIQGEITMANEAAEKILGYSQGELIGKHTFDLIAQEKGHLEKGIKFMNMLYQDNLVAGQEQSWLKKDGSTVEIEVSAALLKNTKGDLTGGIASIRDITERKKAEREIKEARDFLKSVIESSKDGIMIFDISGYARSVNSAMVQMTKFSEEGLLGMHCAELTIEDEQERNHILDKMHEFFIKGFTTYEAKHKTKDGAVLNVECSISMIKDNEGKHVAGVAIVRDITERKLMEQQLLQSEKMKSLGELAGGVAHDFNNVLAAILGRAQLLRMITDASPGGQERRKSVRELKDGLEIIERAAKDGAETVRRIQEFARRREDEKYFTSVDLNEIIESSLEFTKVRWKNEAELKGIQIVVQKDFTPFPLTLGISSELREVFTNLINNAIDALPHGGKIKISTFKRDSTIIAKVEDTGIGITTALRERIFDPFFTTKGPQSTGLGLSVSYGIINRHRGTIAVESREGKGTVFTITFPITSKTTEADKVKTVSSEQKKAKILVVEDEAPVRDLLFAILAKGGHQVTCFSDGVHAIELFKKEEFDLVFTDLGMPGMSGWQVAKQIKSIDGKVPIALITGWNVTLRESEMRDSGIDLVVQKPFEVEQVLRLVEEGMVLRDRFKSG